MLPRPPLAGLVLLLAACGAKPEPEERPPASAVQPGSAFRFEPTLTAFRPDGSTMELIAEAGDAARGTLTLVIAHHDGTALSLAQWRFESSGEEGTLAPAGNPTPLLAIQRGQVTDAVALEAFVQTRAAGHSASRRPHGVSADDAAAALRLLHRNAAVTLDPRATPEQRVAALASFTRGLDDDLLFSRKGLVRSLDTLHQAREIGTPEGSARRVSVRWGEQTIALLRKADGWSIDALQ